MTREYLGDKVQRALHSLGADKVAKIIEKIGRKPCGCGGRREALNRWHKRVLKEVEKLKGTTEE